MKEEELRLFVEAALSVHMFIFIKCPVYIKCFQFETFYKFNNCFTFLEIAIECFLCIVYNYYYLFLLFDQ